MVMTMRRTDLPELWWDDFVPPTGLRAEIIQGELVLTPSPTFDHGVVQTRLLRAMDAHLPEGYEIVQGIEWRLAIEGIVTAAPQPDLMVARWQPGRRVVTATPLLAVEVLSPSDGQLLPQGISRIEGKRLDYAANGLVHYLEVESVGDVRTVRRYELRDGGLAVVEVAEGDQLLVAEVPYDYEIRPSRL